MLEGPKGDKKSIGFGAAMGIIIGTVIGALTGNVGLWIVICFVIGAGLGASGLRLPSQPNDGSEN